jgi:hypothetical protein
MAACGLIALRHCAVHSVYRRGAQERHKASALMKLRGAIELKDEVISRLKKEKVLSPASPHGPGSPQGIARWLVLSDDGRPEEDEESGLRRRKLPGVDVADLPVVCCMEGVLRTIYDTWCGQEEEEERERIYLGIQASEFRTSRHNPLNVRLGFWWTGPAWSSLPPSLPATSAPGPAHIGNGTSPHRHQDRRSMVLPPSRESITAMQRS